MGATKSAKDRQGTWPVISGFAGLVGFSILSGILVTAMVAPVLAVTGNVGQASIGIFDNLPGYITLGKLSQQNLIYATRNGAPRSDRDGVPIVGKTGTTDVADQNWLIGTTTKVALAAWVGNTQGHQDLRKISLAGTNGYNAKFDIFRTIMKSLDSDPAYRGTAFPPPDPSLFHDSSLAVPGSAVPAGG